VKRFKINMVNFSVNSLLCVICVLGTAQSFVPTSFTLRSTQKTTTSPMELSNMFTDMVEDRAEAAHDFFDRFAKPFAKDKKSVASHLKRTPDETGAYTVFKHIPTKEMTGISPDMTQLCATLSSRLYDATEIDELHIKTVDDFEAVPFIFDNGGAFNQTSSPFGVVITGKTMILGWRGTSGLMDQLNDVACAPQSSMMWRKHAETIKAQGAMTSVAADDLVTHENDIIKKIIDDGITEIITTGHSLGGGVAQVANLILSAQTEDETSPWHKIIEKNGNISIRSMCFEPPMTTVLVAKEEKKHPESEAFVESLISRSCLTVFGNDPVPRSYGYLTFLEDFAQNCEAEIASDKLHIPKVAQQMFHMRGQLTHLIDEKTDNNEFRWLMAVGSKYVHLGNIIHYENKDAMPRILHDKGAFFKNKAGLKNVFRSVKYEKCDAPLDTFVKDWHNLPVAGPGISFSKAQLGEK